MKDILQGGKFMVPIILASHGPFCEGLLASLEMIAGPQKNIKTLQLHEGQSPESYREKLEELLSGNENNIETLVLCDLKGGTPYNSVAFISQKYKLELITGMNMPMLITLATIRTENSKIEELAELAVQVDNTNIERIDFNFKKEKRHEKLSVNKNR